MAVALDGTIYVGEQFGKGVRRIRNGIVSTIWQGDGRHDQVNGLLLNGESLLYIAAGHHIHGRDRVSM